MKADWSAIKAEYIGGGISQRDLAKKHRVSVNTLIKRANTEGWAKLREEAYNKATTKAQQKATEASAENSVILQRIRRKLLLKLEKEIDRLPDVVGSESTISITDTDKKQRKTKQTIWNMKQLAGTYRDLIEEDFRREKLDLDKQKAESENW